MRVRQMNSMGKSLILPLVGTESAAWVLAHTSSMQMTSSAILWSPRVSAWWHMSSFELSCSARNAMASPALTTLQESHA